MKTNQIKENMLSSCGQNGYQQAICLLRNEARVREKFKENIMIKAKDTQYYSFDENKTEETRI